MIKILLGVFVLYLIVDKAQKNKTKHGGPLPPISEYCFK